MAVIGGILLSLAACGKSATPPEEIRPVRAMLVQVGATSIQNTYAGEIRPRYESALGFRVGGQIQQRLVNAGDKVMRNQVLVRLDPKDLSLSEAGSRANLAAQKAQLEVERADLERDRKLLAENVVSQSAYDRQSSKFLAAQAAYTAGEAQLRQSGNQVEYALLRADHDGTISSVAAEAGQVVAAGQTVITLADAGTTEVAVNVPEDQIQRIKLDQPAQVSLWSAAGKTYPGRVREISASADPATRTYAVRVTLLQAPDDLRYGMTASVQFEITGLPDMIQLPLPALVEHEGKAGVWIFKPEADAAVGTVDFRPVVSAGLAGNAVMIGSGLKPGEIVVTAGAPLLHAGQKVRLLDPALASKPSP